MLPVPMDMHGRHANDPQQSPYNHDDSGQTRSQGVSGMKTTDPPQANTTHVPQGMINDAQQQVETTAVPKRIGYGLPCANCRSYYAADLTACPICQSKQRVVPVVSAATGSGASEPLPDPAALEEERERFLREFKAQVYASHMQINAATSFRCAKDENHQGGFEPAAVCQQCYDRTQEHADLMEAALHIDLKEAAQVIYDAVWS